MLGIDVSNHQGQVNWKKVAGHGVKFAWVKATEGTHFSDPFLRPNLEGARAAGVPVGAYHFARPDRNQPKAEADYFLAALGPLKAGDLLPVLDFETAAPALNEAALTAWAARWLEIVEERIGGPAVFYSYPSFIDGRMGGARLLDGCKLWLADYGPDDGRQHSPRYQFPHMAKVARQFTSKGRVAGVNGNCDLNVAGALGPIRYKPPAAPPKAAGPRPRPKRKETLMPQAKPFPVRLVERARVFVGVKEQPPGSNRGPYDPRKKGGIDDWCRRANGLTGYPWCAAFLCAMAEDCGYRVTDPRRASVGFLEGWARTVGKLVDRPLRGDLVCYRFDQDNWPDHIGVVDRVLAIRWRGGRFVGMVRTIEGNTSAGNDANGGQVQIRYRWLDGRCGFVRLFPQGPARALLGKKPARRS